MYPNFNWWIGVVEDRVDPAMLGRCRVRIIGYHTSSTEDLPTVDLPWAVPVSPTTSPSISGIGDTPAYVQGSTVLGFFADGEEGQQPIIVGTLGGKPRNKNTDPSIGFSDPDGKFPRSEADLGLNELQEPDLSRLSRNGDAETHASLLNKRTARQKDIPRAVAPHIESVSSDISGAAYDRQMWEEPHPRFGEENYTYNASNEEPNFNNNCSVYPFNKVRETESGHVFEIDDTPNNERIHEYHSAGTFYEVQADGSKITKVVGDEYEITLKDKKVFVKGSCDVTIGGDARVLVTGDMYQEIGGNLFTTVAGNRVTKVVGNDFTEVLSGQSTNVSRDHSFRTGGNQTDTVIGNRTETVGGDKVSTVGGNFSSVSVGSTSSTAILGYSLMSTTGNVNLSAPTGNFKAIGLNMSLSAALNQTLTASVQLVEASTTQTLSAITSQTVVAPVRNITGVTTHTGAYNITGAVAVTGAVTVTGALTVTGTVLGGIVRQGTIELGMHRHLGVTSGGNQSGLPTQ